MHGGKSFVRKLLRITAYLITGFVLIITLLGLLLWQKPELAANAYNSLRPLMIADGGQRCLQKLYGKGVEFEPLLDYGSEMCVVKNPVLVRAFSKTALSSPVVLNCSFAEKVDTWLVESDVRRVEHFGTYNCRNIAGTGILSEHSFGAAIDISAIDGASVLKNWNGPPERQQILKSAVGKACAYFFNVLTPESNAAHADHLHLDRGLGLGCMRFLGFPPRRAN